MVRLQCDEQLANGGSSKQMLNPWQAELWQSRGAMELVRACQISCGWLGWESASLPALSCRSSFLVGPPSTLSVTLCPPCLAWQPVFHLCLQASSYRCSSGRASGWQGLRGAFCSILYNNLSIPPNSKNLAMLLRCGGTSGCQDTHMRSQNQLWG